jgi:bifunctional non-homologous end joining protein LigD
VGWLALPDREGGRKRPHFHAQRHNDWSAQLPAIVGAARQLKARSFSIDGELIASSQGFDFYSIPASIQRRQVTVIAFDLLFLNGKDLRPFVLNARKEALATLVAGSQDLIQLSEAFHDGIGLLAAAEVHGLEGIVSKCRDLPYRSGPCAHWVKVKAAGWRQANKQRYKLFERKR